MRLFLVALAVISLVASTNHAFTPPITASTPPMSEHAIISSSANYRCGRPLMNNNKINNQTDTTRKSILHRLFRSSSPSNNNIRGNSYGTVNNSTVLSPADAALAVGVKPTKPDATKNEWQRAWRIHRFSMKILHAVDGCKPKDSKLAL